MNNEQGKMALEAINQMGEFTIDDLDTAMAVVEIQEKLSNISKKNHEALMKTVQYSDEEKDLAKKHDEKMKSDDFETFLSDNRGALDSLFKKNAKMAEKDAELRNKPIKVNLPKIDKNKLPMSEMKVWMLAAIKPLLK